ncbi:MAG TPA: hypothetical protein VKE41_22165, partial [Roseiflexaceae bacterium]|nr:hypothetical protein [Roseiflexaceae bacterium]
SGRHPFLVQIAAAALFESNTYDRNSQARYGHADRMIQGWATVHFEDVWQRLSQNLKRTALTLALAEFSQVVEPPAADVTLSDDDHEMRWLADGDLIEATANQRCASWRGERWRICASSFARWLVESGKWMEPHKQEETPPLDSTEREEQVAVLRPLLRAHRNRLRELELKHAKLGTAADPSVINEIDEIRQKIIEVERDLRRWGGHV